MQRVRVINLRDDQRKQLDFPVAIKQLAWRSDPDTVAVLDVSGQIWLADLASSTPPRIIYTAGPSAYALGWSPSGQQLTLATKYGVRVIDVNR